MKWLLGALVGAILGALAGVPAEAQNVNINCATGTGGTQWNPASPSNPCPVAPVAYPVNSTVVTCSATGTTAATSCTLAGTSGKTTYICGFVLTSGGTSSAVVANATVAGTITGTLNFAYVSVSSGQGLLGVAFPQCIPASAVNTSIVVTEPAGSTGTVAAVTAWGYQL